MTIEKKKFGQDIIDFLVKKLNISESLFAGLLDITTQTLSEWKKTDFSEGFIGKSKRLELMYNFISLASEKGVENSDLLSLLNELVDDNDENSYSPMFFILNEKNNTLFNEITILLISRYLN